MIFTSYSKNGKKFRPSTNVKVLSKNITQKGAISTSHPNYDEGLLKIKEVQDRLENIVSSYYQKLGEKPDVEWVEKQFYKPLIDARKDLDDAVCYWKELIAEKKKQSVMREPSNVMIT